MSFEAVALEAMALEAVTFEAMALQAVTLEAMSASCVLHEFSLLDVSPRLAKQPGRNDDLCQEGRYAAAINESREKGSRKLTCPKVDMPKSR